MTEIARLVIRHEVAAAGHVEGATFMICRCGGEFWDSGVEASTKFAGHLRDMATERAKFEHMPSINERANS